MKVILTRDVRGVGRAHEEVSAADGYALNYLIPQRFAVPATAAALKEAQSRRKRAEERRALDAALLAQSLASLAEARIAIKVKANEKGHLYDAIAAPEIARAVKESARIDIPEDAIRIEKPIKEVGTFDVSVAFGGTFGKFSIILEAVEV